MRLQEQEILPGEAGGEQSLSLCVLGFSLQAAQDEALNCTLTGLPQKEGRLGWLSGSSRATVLQSKKRKRWCGLGLLSRGDQKTGHQGFHSVPPSREKRETLDELRQIQGWLCTGPESFPARQLVHVGPDQQLRSHPVLPDPSPQWEQGEDQKGNADNSHGSRPRQFRR